MTDILDTSAPVAPVSEAEKVVQSLLDSLPEDLRKEPSLSSFKDTANLAKSYVELNKKLGKRFDDLTPEDIKLLNAKLGVPSKAEEYALSLSDGLKPLAEGIEAKALELGIPKSHLESLIGFLSEKDKVISETSKKGLEDSLKAEQERFVKIFGDAGPKKLELAKKALESLEATDVEKILTEKGLGSNPEVIQLLSKIGAMFEEGTVSVNNKSAFVSSKDEAKRQLSSKFLDQDFKRAYNSATHPKHNAAVEEVTRLLKLANS